MIPLRQLALVAPHRPAVDALPQLGRFGFALSAIPGGLGYVEEHDLLERLLLTADVQRRVADHESRSRNRVE